jgi:hypothetical protein
MADEQLKIKIGADVAGAVTGINQVNTSLKNLKQPSIQAASSLQSLGRVAQDLPFGFIGIQNNLNPLLESFQRLKAESGSSGKALKALAGSLMGAGGLGLALSLASAAFLIYQNGIAGFNRDTKKAKETVDEYAKSVREATREVAEESSKVGVLIAFIKNETTSRQDRVAAVKELQRISPQYFANLDAERVTIDQLTVAYQNYNTGLRRVIEAKIKTDQLIKVTEERLKLDEKLNRKGQEEILVNGKLVKARNFYIDQTGQLNKDSLRRTELLKTELALQEQIAGLTAPITAKPVKTTSKETTLKTPTLKIEAEKTVFASDNIRFDEIDAPEKNQFSPASMFGKIRQPFGDMVQVFTEAEEAQKRLHARNLQIAEGITTQLAPAFTGLFEDILSGSKTTFADFGKAILGVIKKLVAAAAAAAILAAIVGVVTGGASFGGGMSTFLGGAKSIFGGMTGLNLQSNPGFGSGSLTGAARGGLNQRLVTEVSGQNLRIILQRANNDIGRNG